MNHPDLLAVHASDVHVDDDITASRFGDGTAQLRRVLATARSIGADIVLLAGDTLDHNRLPPRVLERTAELLADFARPVVILPGNHDPATEDSPYRQAPFANLANTHILGVTCGASLRLANMDLEVWGRPHVDFIDMEPLVGPGPRTATRRIVMAHGHYDPIIKTLPPRPGWLFGDAEIASCDADYLALGHWNRAVQVGRGPMPAWYSGSPDFADSVNLVSFYGRQVVMNRRLLLG